MSSTVIGLFNDLPTAQRVERALEEADFPHDRIFLAAHDATGTLGRSRGAVSGVASGIGSSLFTGDFVETLAENGVPRDKAALYAEGIRRGGAAVLLLRLADEDAERAAAVLRRHRPIDPARRLQAYQDHGYGGYSPVASPFSEEEVEAERTRYADDHHGEDVAVVYVM